MRDFLWSMMWMLAGLTVLALGIPAGAAFLETVL